MKRILIALSFAFSCSISFCGEPQLASDVSPYGDAYIKGLPILETIKGVDVDSIIEGGGGGGISSIGIYPGAANGTIQYNVNGGESEQVAVTGLGSAAYTAYGAYATAAQGLLAASAIQVESDPVWSAASGGIESRISALEQGGGGGGSGVTSWNGQTGAVTFAELDPTYAADKQGTMQLGDVDIAGSLTLGQPPLSPAEAANKAYVDTAIGWATQDVSDNYAVKPDPRAGYVMPPQVFDFLDSNTFTLDAAPKFIMEGMILSATSFTYLQEEDWEFSGNQFTVKNVALQSGDKVKVTYAIQ